jgi:hypothetical protein
MLRLHDQGDAKDLPSLHHSKYAKPTDSLYSMGKELFIEVCAARSNTRRLLRGWSEVFGASEDESPEMDHSEDSENGLLSHFLVVTEHPLTVSSQGDREAAVGVTSSEEDQGINGH